MPQFGATWHVVTHLDVGFRLTTMPKMLRAEIWLICRKWFSCSSKADLGYCNWKGVASTVADSLQSPLPQCCGSRLRAVDTGLHSKAIDEAPQVQHFRHCSDLDSKTRFLVALASAIRIVQVGPTEQVSTSL